jgi:hypothetical protein
VTRTIHVTENYRILRQFIRLNLEQNGPNCERRSCQVVNVLHVEDYVIKFMTEEGKYLRKKCMGKR